MAEPQNQSALQKLKQYSKDGYGTDAKGLAANRNRVLYGAVLAFGALALIAPDLWNGPSDGLPKDDRLVAVSGRLADGRETNKEILLTLEGHRTPYSYSSKADAFPQVWKALCKNCDTTVWVDPADTRATPDVFQIAVGGHVVRSYADVKKAWISDNSIAPWIGGFLLCGGLVLAGVAARQQQRLSRLKSGGA